MYFVLILVFLSAAAEEVSIPPNCNCSHLLYSDDFTEPTPTFPPTSFTCWGRYDGYYADIEVDCTVFHYCQTWQYPNGLNETVKWDFACPRSTIFNQKILSCTPPSSSFDCQESPDFYWINYNLTGTRTTPDPESFFSPGHHLIGGQEPQSEYFGTTPETDLVTTKPENSFGDTDTQEVDSESNFPTSGSQSVSETSVSSEENTGVVSPESDRVPDFGSPATISELIPSDSSQHHQSSSLPDSAEFKPESNINQNHFPGSNAFITQVPEFIASDSSQGHLDNNFQTVQKPDSDTWTTFTTPHSDSTYGFSSEEDHAEGFTTQSDFFKPQETKLPNHSQGHHKPHHEEISESSYDTPLSESSTSNLKPGPEVTVSPQTNNFPEFAFSTQQSNSEVIENLEPNSSNISSAPSAFSEDVSETVRPTSEYVNNEQPTPNDYSTHVPEISNDFPESITHHHIPESEFSKPPTTSIPEIQVSYPTFGQEHAQTNNFSDSTLNSSSNHQQNDLKTTETPLSGFTFNSDPSVPGLDSASSKPISPTTEIINFDPDYSLENNVSESEEQPSNSSLVSTTSFPNIASTTSNSSISLAQNSTEKHPEQSDLASSNLEAVNSNSSKSPVPVSSDSNHSFTEHLSSSFGTTSNPEVENPDHNQQQPDSSFDSSNSPPFSSKPEVTDKFKPQSSSYASTSNSLPSLSHSQGSDNPKLNHPKNIVSLLLESTTSGKELSYKLQTNQIREATTWTPFNSPKSVPSNFSKENSEKPPSLTSSVPTDSQQNKLRPDIYTRTSLPPLGLNQHSKFDSNTSVSTNSNHTSSNNRLTLQSNHPPVPTTNTEEKPIKQYTNSVSADPIPKKPLNSTSVHRKRPTTNHHNSQSHSQSHHYTHKPLIKSTRLPGPTISSLEEEAFVTVFESQRIKKINSHSILFPQSDSKSSEKIRNSENKPSVKHNLRAIIFPH